MAERKVFTYKDTEKAKEYIGKPGFFSNDFYVIHERLESAYQDKLSTVLDKEMRINEREPFVSSEPGSSYQFFSPDPEPVEKLVPFTAVDWPLFHLKPVTNKRWGALCAATVVGWDGKRVEISDQDSGVIVIPFTEFVSDWAFLDGTPCGKKVTGEESGEGR